MAFEDAAHIVPPASGGGQFYPDHEQYLLARAVPLAVAAAAGLRSVTGEEAQVLLHRTAPVRSDGLAIPYAGVDPHYVRIRFSDSEAVGARYLAPGGREVFLYVPPLLARHEAQLPTGLGSALIVVESPIKALALTAIGLDAVGLGGTGTTLAKGMPRRLNMSWHSVQIAGREVVICFDAGRAINPHVARDEARLAQALRAAGASSVRVAALPLTSNGEDQGPDDFIAAQGPHALYAVLGAAVSADPLERVAAHAAAGLAAADLLDDQPYLHSVLEATAGTSTKTRDALVRAGLRKKDFDAALAAAEEDRGSRGGIGIGDDLEVCDGRICSVTGCAAVPLCNFEARILEERVIDDGFEEQRKLVIAGSLEDGTPLPKITLTPDDFADSLWPMRRWGTVAKTTSGARVADQLRVALQKLSDPVVHVSFAHTGWREPREDAASDAGLPIFLHANGAIGATDLSVELPDRLAYYALPSEPSDVAEAVRTSLRLLELGPREAMTVLLAMTYRAPLQSTFPADFAAFIVAKTGSLKTTLAKLAAAHFGHRLAETPITSFEASVASIEHCLHALADVLALVDDFKPANTHAKDEHQVKARQVFGAIGNQEGRGRMRSDGRVRQARPPRALVVSTGETLPTGESTVARLLPVHLPRGAVDMAKLSAAQASIEALPHAMSAFIHYLRPRVASLKLELRSKFAAFRERFRNESAHLRSPSALAHLMLGLDQLWKFSVHVGALTEAQARDYQEDALTILGGLSRKGLELARETDPALRFLDFLRGLITQGRVLLQEDLKRPLFQSRDRDAPIGEPIGWAARKGKNGGSLFFLQEPTYRAVFSAMQSSGEPMPLTATSLWRRLRDQGVTRPGDRPGHLTRRVMLGGERTEVIVMPRAVLFPEHRGGGGGSDGPANGGSIRFNSDSDDGNFGEVHERTTEPGNRTNSGTNRTTGAAGPDTSREEQPPVIAAASPPASPSAGPVGTVGRVEIEEKSRGGIASPKAAHRSESALAPSFSSPDAGPTGPVGHWTPTCGENGGSSTGAHPAPRTAADQPDQWRAGSAKAARSIAADGLGLLRKAPLGENRPVFCLKTAKRLLGEGAVKSIDYSRHAELAAHLVAAGLADVAELEFDLLPVVAEMERAGIGVDATAWAELVARAERSVAVDAALLAAGGLANPADDAQLRAALRTRGVDQPSTSWKALARHRGDPFVAALIGYRRSAGFLNSVGRAVLDSAQRGGGRVHATFDPLAAPTGRMSCSKPNLHAVPKASQYRRCVTPAPGTLFVVADYVAIEMRVLAALTGDEALTRVFAEGGDPHAATAAAVLRKAVANVAANERQRAKAVNFGFAFGMGPAKFIDYAFGSFGVEITTEEAESMRQTFLKTYPGVAQWQRQTRNEMPLEVRTRSGRRRLFSSRENGYCERLNTPVQGTAADGLKLAMILLHERLRGTGARLVLAVHDELLVETPGHCAAEVRELVENSMVEAMARFVQSVPIKVVATVRKNWAEPVED